MYTPHRALMSRTSTTFVAVCMLLIAGSAGALAFVTLRWGVGESGFVAVTLLLVMVIGFNASLRAREKATLDLRLGDLARLSTDMAGQIDDLSRRIERIEGSAIEKAKAVAAPLNEEVEALGSLVRQFAETLTHHEQAIVEATEIATRGAQALAIPTLVPVAPVAAPAPVVVTPSPAKSVVAAAEQVARPRPRALPVDPDGPLADMSVDDATALVRRAVGEGRMDIHLQPIVTLPQRKVRFYEVLSRLRLADGSLLMPADYMTLARQGGLMPQIDTQMVMRAVQVQRRMKGPNRDMGLFCNISPDTLADSNAARMLIAYMETNKVLAPLLVFELSQAALDNLSAEAKATMEALRALGFRFSLDQVASLRVNPGALAAAGFAFVKAPAALLVGDNGEHDIHPLDFGRLLARHGIDLIVEKIESEQTVADVLDTDARYGQGFAFSRPRPVSADLAAAADEVRMPPPPVAAPVAAAPAPAPAPADRTARAAEEALLANPNSVGAAVLAALTKDATARRSSLSQGVRALVRGAAETKA